MATIAIFQHEPSEPPGLIYPALRRSGHTVPIVHVTADRLPPVLPGEYEGLVLMGGPMAVYEAEQIPWLQTEVDLIRQALQRRVPVLGVCLGSQILAAAAGAKVYPGSRGKEIGWGTIQLTDAGRKDALCRYFHTIPQLHVHGEDTVVFQWHGDTFDLPSGAQLLASSERYPQQMFRLNETAYGVQFHFEVNENHIKHWLDIWKHDAEEAGVDSRSVRSAMQQHLGMLNRRGEELTRAFGRLVEASKGQIVPPEPAPQVEEAKEEVAVRDTRIHPLTPQEQEEQAAVAKQATAKESFVASRRAKDKPRKVSKRATLPPAIVGTPPHASALAPKTAAAAPAADTAEEVPAGESSLSAPLGPAAVAHAQAELQEHADAALENVGAAEEPAEEASAEPPSRLRKVDLGTYEL